MPVCALTEVETVALWAGLLVGVASVVLAIVAIYFSIEVDRRSTATATETSRALERIESVVSSQSRDTRDLIKVGWERMLPAPAHSHSAPATATGDEGVREIAIGIADEIRANLGIADRDGDSAVEDGGSGEAWAYQGAVDQLQATIESQLHAARHTPLDAVQFWLDRLENMSDEAQALAHAIGRSHITADQLEKLGEKDSLMRDALAELRSDGLLVPLRGYNRQGDRTLVYWYPPAQERAVKAALLLAPDPDEDLTDLIQESLDAVGYPDSPSIVGS